MARPVLSDVTSSYASVAATNANSALIEQGFIDALSRNDLTNNFMQVPLDMNSNQILNLGEPLSNNSAATKKYVDDLAFTLSGVDVGLFVTDAELAAAVDVLRAGGITYTPTYATLTD